MGTRADFYVGRRLDAEWLLSIAWDGHPRSMPDALLDATSLPEFQQALADFMLSRDDVTLPRQGWPWPWDTSRTTDYAYAFDGGKVWASCFGSPWFDPHNEPEDILEDRERYGEDAVFPDMSGRKNVAGGKRSGLVLLRRRGGVLGIDLE